MDALKPKPLHAEVMSKRRRALSEACASFLTSDSQFVWEIGCGHGHFLNAYAKEHPETLCVGVDIVLDRIERAERKRERAKLSNLHFLQAEARDFIDVIPAGARFSAIYMLFPDPWPKRRHHKHRLLDSRFLHAAAQRAGQGTRFHFRTDHEAYFADAKATFAAHADWDTCPTVEWPFELPTIFQQKALEYQSLVAARNHH
jgi:tRNA (guanine-N7-)-methyltransferase